MDYPLSQAVTLDLYNGKFDDGVPGVRPASIIPSSTINALIDEILAVQAEGGQVNDETKKTQLRDAIKAMIDAQSGNFCLDTGVANAYVVALDPPIAAYGDSFTVRFRVGHANTLPSTLDAGGGPVALNNDIDAALAAGDLPGGAIATATYVPALGHFNLTSMVPSQAMGRLLRISVFTASGTWTAGAGTTAVEVEVLGGGGGAGGVPAVGSLLFGVSSGGGAGGRAKKFISGVASPQTVTIGAGGVGGIGSGSATAGGTSSFGALISATGGSAGVGATGGNAVGVNGGAGGVGVGGDINVPGMIGGSGWCSAPSGNANGQGGDGGSTSYGGGGAPGYGSDGGDASGYGAGGSGLYQGDNAVLRVGGKGAPGLVIVKEYA